jgi:hypothetical protein
MTSHQAIAVVAENRPNLVAAAVYDKEADSRNAIVEDSKNDVTDYRVQSSMGARMSSKFVTKWSIGDSAISRCHVAVASNHAPTTAHFQG